MRFKSYFLKDIEKLELKEIEKEPQEGEVLVKVKAALTCGTDTKMYKRGHPQFPFPSPFGHEASGIVAVKGKGVSILKEGDEVMFPISYPCLRCSFCLKGLENQCENLFEEKVWGAFSEYILMPKKITLNTLYIKPKNLSFEEAALLDPLASVIFAQSFVKETGLNTLIIGAGPMGYLHGVYLKNKNFEVTISDIDEKKLEIYKKLEIKTLLLEGNWEKNREPFDFIIECSGTFRGFESALKVLAKGGKICLFAGMPSKFKLNFDGSLLHYNQNTIYGSFHYDRKSVLMAYNLLCEKALPLREIFSGYYSLEEIPQVMEKVLNGEGLKFVINP